MQKNSTRHVLYTITKHATNKRKKRKEERLQSMTLKCKVKTKIIMKMNYKLFTKITKHNPERKNLKSKLVINEHHQMQNISQK
jgi:hypothetical protein